MLEIDPADLVKMEEKGLTDADRKSLHEKYDGKLVRYKGRAKVPVIAPTAGVGFIVEAESKVKAHAMVFPARKGGGALRIEAVLSDMKADALIVVEGIGQFPGELQIPAIIGAKIISLELVPTARPAVKQLVSYAPGCSTCVWW